MYPLSRDLVYFVITSLSLYHKAKGSTNLAVFKVTSQSDTPNPNTPSEQAANGVVEPHTSTDLCTFVGDAVLPVWWQVDLGQTVTVGSVTISPAPFTYGRPSNFIIEVYSESQCQKGPRLCHNYPGTFTVGITETLTCAPDTRGRYVRMSQTVPLFLCEFFVYEPSTPALESFTEGVYKGTKDDRATFQSPVMTSTESTILCAMTCFREEFCRHFNFKPLDNDVGMCEVPTFSNGSDVILSDTDWYYYETDPCFGL